MAGYPISFWAGFLALVVVLLAFDLGILHRKQPQISAKNALGMCLFYFALAMVFNAWVYTRISEQSGTEFLMGYLIELSLSVDNLFVFLLVFTHFAVPAKYQHRVLFWGILGAVVFRGVMIGLGTTVVKEFSDILYLFGAFLIFTGGKMLLAVDSEPDMENNRIMGFMRKRFRVTQDYHGDRFMVKQDGKRYFTPLFLVLILIEISDIIFAVDSIPAIFAVTTDPFIVFTSNIFAILGLRSLYFAMASIVHRFEYLKYGLSLVLVFIGVKMLVNHHYDEKIIATDVALLITAATLAISILISLIKTRGHTQPERTGWVPGSPSHSERDEH